MEMCVCVYIGRDGGPCEKKDVVYVCVCREWEWCVCPCRETGISVWREWGLFGGRGNLSVLKGQCGVWVCVCMESLCCVFVCGDWCVCMCLCVCVHVSLCVCACVERGVCRGTVRDVFLEGELGMFV